MTSFHPFRLDTVNECLWRKSAARDEERILLAPKAYGVLRYLVERAGSLVTTDELLDAVWPDTHIQPEGLKSQILQLRRVLGDDPKRPQFIETLPRRGYRFIGARSEEATAQAASQEGETARLVGRDGPLAELGEGLRRAMQRKRQIVFVTGESGIGKTALVDTFQAQAEGTLPGLRIARGQCVEGYGGKEPYYPMLEALGQLCRGPGSASIIATLAAQAPTWLAQFPALLKREHRETLQREILGATRERMLREICEAVETITTDSPLLLVFEDLQWVDQATVDLIGALARRRAPAKLMLIGTYRPVDLTLSDHPLKALKQELLLHQLCRETALEPLSEAHITEFLAVPSPETRQPAGLVELMHRQSGGNPLFMVAALEHLTQRGLISREGSGWQLRLPLEQIVLGVPEGLRQMIEAQIERLSMEERGALEAASVIGAAFTVDVGAVAAGLEPDCFEDLCERLSRRHRIVRDAAAPVASPDAGPGPRYEFVHALYREVFYQRQTPSRRAKLHRRVGERLEALFASRLSDVALELADHFEKCADWPRAIKYLRLAAGRAGARHAYPEATALLEQALGLARQLPEAARATTETEILEKVATIYVAAFDMRALETYEALRVRAVHHGLIDVHLRALAGTAFFLSWISAPRCLEVVERALKLSSGHADPLLRARIRMNCFVWRVMAGGWNAADAEGCRKELAEIASAGDRFKWASHLIDYSFIQWSSSEYRAAHESAVQGRSILFEGRDENPYLSRQYWASLVVSSCSLMFLGEWGAALQENEAALALLAKNGDDHRAHRSWLYRAWLHLHGMDFASAVAICDSVLPSLKDPSRTHTLRVGLIVAGAAETGLGNHNRALEHLLAASNEMDRQQVRFDWYWRMQLASALTEASLGKHDLANARRHAARFLEITQATAERTWQALAWEANARVAMAGEDMAHAQECIGRALATIDSGDFPLAAWRVGATAAELFERTGDLASAQHHRELSRATIRKLAHSLPPDEPLRHTFLSATAVGKVGADAGSYRALKVA